MPGTRTIRCQRRERRRSADLSIHGLNMLVSGLVQLATVTAPFITDHLSSIRRVRHQAIAGRLRALLPRGAEAFLHDLPGAVDLLGRACRPARASPCRPGVNTMVKRWRVVELRDERLAVEERRLDLRRRSAPANARAQYSSGSRARRQKSTHRSLRMHDRIGRILEPDSRTAKGTTRRSVTTG